MPVMIVEVFPACSKHSDRSVLFDCNFIPRHLNRTVVCSTVREKSGHSKCMLVRNIATVVCLLNGRWFHINYTSSVRKCVITNKYMIQKTDLKYNSGRFNMSPLTSGFIAL